MLDADRALVLAGAAGRALPEHLLACRPRRACDRASPASSASCVCRMIVFGFSSLPAPHAGQFTWQRPHSTQVNASSTLLLPRSFTVSRPTCSFSKSRFGRLPSSGDFRNTVIGDSTRWKMLRRRNQRHEREDHDRVHPPVHPLRPATPSSSRNVSRNVIISVAMNSAMTTDSIDTFVPSADRPHERAPDQQVAMPPSTAIGKRRQQRAGRRGTSRYASDRRCRGRAGTRSACSRRTRRSPRRRTRARGRPPAAR